MLIAKNIIVPFLASSLLFWGQDSNIGALGEKVGDPNPAYVCSGCLLVLGLVEESVYQVHLENYLTGLCDGDACRTAVHEVIMQAESGRVPEEICRDSGLCNDECVLFSEWPIQSLPPSPPDWPIERRRSLKSESKNHHHDKDHQKSHGEIDYTEFGHVMTSVFSHIQAEREIDRIPSMGVISMALGRIRTAAEGISAAERDHYDSTPAFEECAKNVSCHLINFVDGHLPLKDADGDRFAPADAPRLRGSHWRGADCNDELRDVYPGRRATEYDATVDHNCNGIFGGNETAASFEELFCADSQARGLVMLGDSATAHFHIPPQWLTANGWNLNQLLPDAEDELDVPHCSWGTAHVSAEECPYQHPVPGLEDGSIVSIYTQLRGRNRCNHNDFQNIGVNGARMTSSMQLVNSVGRDQQLDNPVLAYLALIGNDVCNGHTGFDHMTTPDSFYEHAMETLTALDEGVLPAGSHVVGVALFNGELLYDTMHALQHPIGSSYDDLYALMNCEEENPCWGWLNADPVVRANTTRIAKELSAVYQDIEDQQDFKNFKFIYYEPNWVQLFSDYAAAGLPLSNLVEPSDGFHPSQAGNAMFALKFFEWLEENHPEALGPVNPHNAEIDALFFNAASVAASA